MKESNLSKNPVNSAGSTMYDKLNELNREMEQGIFSLSGTDTGNSNLQADLDQIAGIASREKSSEAVASILLFRKYAEIANHLKESNHEQNQNSWELSSFVHEDSDAESVGTSAFGRKIFWLRVAVFILSFISFVVMSTVPNVTKDCFSPVTVVYVSLISPLSHASSYFFLFSYFSEQLSI
jgi:hypothetical protein